MSVTAGNTYQLLTSTNLQTWTPTGAPFLAETNTISQDFDLAGGRQFFKVEQMQ
jgi:hypothetical protein